VENNQRIVISGANGFVGKNLSSYLAEKGYKIQAISRAAHTGLNWPGIIDQNQTKIDALAIVHLAGKAHDTQKTSDAGEYFEINTQLTQKLFDIFLQSETQVFIYMSSVKAAADTVQGILTEDVVPAPGTPYGQSKRKAEEYILDQKLPAGKRAFILRPCMIHGPGNKGNLNLLYKFAKKGLPYPLAAYENERSFLSVANLNFIIEQLISNAAIPGGIYNIADDMPLSTNKVMEIIAGTDGKKPRLWKINPGAINLLAKIGDKLHLPLNSERLKKLTESYVVSNTKIKQALNITHLPLSSEEGLRLTIQSFQSS
jgi:nucleoside-diphosphate-sugar epimerase